MKVSSKVLKPLGTLLAGDRPSIPYLSGPKLVDFFNECGFDDIYGAGFPSRWQYAMEKVATSNGTDQLRVILEEYVDPRRFGGDEEITKIVVEEINSLIKYDGFELKQTGALYKVSDIKGNFIKSETLKTIGHEFVTEQIGKCHEKIFSEDFNGAITNARTLTEAVLIHLIETIEKTEIKNDGNLLGLWSRTKKALKIDFKRDDLPEFVFQIISGLDTSLNGLAALSNNAGDRHANKFKTKRHHAKLSVNLAMTICDFLIDILQEQKKSDG